MKNFVRKALLSATVLLTFASVSYSQDSDASSQDNKAAQRAELVTRCERAADELEVLRPLAKAQAEELEAADKVIAQQAKKQTLTDEQLAAKTAEAASLRSALSDSRIAIDEQEKALAEYKKALKSMTKRKNFFKTLAKGLAITTAAAGIAAAVLILDE